MPSENFFLSLLMLLLLAFLLSAAPTKDEIIWVDGNWQKRRISVY